MAPPVKSTAKVDPIKGNEGLLKALRTQSELTINLRDIHVPTFPFPSPEIEERYKTWRAVRLPGQMFVSS
ncbi:hypothetical protein AM571_PA00317 (plasmid) [Rhizobium etli 8C-3]|uniref:Uncharacterized protein n=1 Tax=Rhizobium etli 8C-3 TaxID=538025 RepID=A0A1L5PAL1_RHIET|nr:hypothetical protein AM571_PA00317 [Rhizobium etli 8C-3]